MTEASDDTARVWELIDEIGFCMLTTPSGGILRARPMSAYADHGENAVYFLTDVASHKDEEIACSPNVCLAFADSKGQKYVSISGSAEIQNDREKIRDLWATPAKAWWDSPEDPSIRILKVTPSGRSAWLVRGVSEPFRRRTRLLTVLPLRGRRLPSFQSRANHAA